MKRLFSPRPLLAALFLTALCGAADAQPQDPNRAGAQPRFDIFEYRVEGNSVLDDGTIEKALLPYLGEAKTFADLEAARAALEGSYAREGWLTVSVSIPEQRIDEGEITLMVLEGAVGKLRVRGAEYHLNSGIRAAVPELAEGKVPNFEYVQQQIAAASRPDLRITPVMKAGLAPGTVDVGLEIDDEAPFHGSLVFSNWHSPNTTPQRLSAALTYDNLWQAGHSLSATAQWSPQNLQESSQFGLTYVIPVRRDALALYAVRSRNNYSTIAGAPGLGVAGSSDIYGLRYVMPLPGLDDYSHSLTAGFDYKDVKQSVQLAGSPDTGSPIRYAPVTIGYSGSILGKNSATKFEAGSVIGVRGFLHGDNDPVFNAKRLGATARFSRLKLGLERNQTLDGWALHGRIDLQLASEPLISDEQYAAGGADNVRGYLEGEEYGDDAVHASVQIETPSLALGDTSAAWKLAGVAFYDAAKLHNQNVGFPTPAYKLIRGRGLGLRLQGPKGAALELDWARAMDATAYTSAGEQRLYGRLTIAF